MLFVAYKGVAFRPFPVIKIYFCQTLALASQNQIDVNGDVNGEVSSTQLLSLGKVLNFRTTSVDEK